jgi:hypothetical protein
MDVRDALRQAAAENGWSSTQVAAAAGLTDSAIRKFYDGTITTLKSDAVLALMHKLPGFAERLGFVVQAGLSSNAA